MGAGRCSDCGRLWGIGVWRHGLKGVDWEGVEEFVGYNEWSFVRPCESLVEDLFFFCLSA